MSSGLVEQRLFLIPAMLGLLIVLIGGGIGLQTDRARAGPAAPANDDFANAALAPEPLPFGDTIDTTAAGRELSEPFEPCGEDVDLLSTVWYSFTPSADVVVTADTFGSDFPAGVVPYVGASLETLVPVACQGFSLGEVVFPASAGVTYSIQAGGREFPPSGSLSFQMTVKPPPIKGNDDFADSVLIPEPLPFSNTQNVRGATLEAGEPQPCFSLRQTVWYSFTPTSDSVLTASTNGSDFSAGVAAYRGTSLDTLTSIGCQGFASSNSFTASAGVTYFFQVGTPAGHPGNLDFVNPGNLVFNLSSAACPATGCVEVVMNVAGAACDDPLRPSTCDVPRGAELILSVHALAVPPEGYIAMQTFVEFGDELSYKPTVSAFDEIAWPDCDSGVVFRAQFDGTMPGLEPTGYTVSHGCLTTLIPPFPISHHVGTLVEFTLTCSPEVSSTGVRLLAYNWSGSGGLPTVASSSGTAFALPDISQTTVVPKLRDLTVNCVEPPPPVGGISLDSDLRPLPLASSGASGGSYGVVTLSIAIGAAVALLAGIGWYSSRRWLR